MSEKTPQSYNPQANADFEAFTTKRDKEKLISDIIGDSDVDSDRYNEGLIYYSHLEALANETDEQREARLYKESLHQVSDEKLASDWDEALQENTEHDAAVRNERIQNNKHLSIAERASLMAIAQHEKLAAAIKAGDQEEAERIEERIESTVELIESQQAKDQEENGDINDDIFNSFVNTIQSETASFEVTPAAAPEAEDKEESENEEDGAERLDAEKFVVPDDGNAEWKAVKPETEDEEGGIVLPEMRIINLPTTTEPESNESTPESESKDAESIVEKTDDQVATATPWYRRALNRLRKNKEDGDSKNEKRSNKKAFSILALGTVAAGLVLGANYLQDSKGPAENDQEISREYPDDYSDTKSTGGDHEADISNETLAKERAALMQADAWNIPEGGGGERLMRSLGLNGSDWYTGDFANKLLNRFPESFYTERGDVRIANPGELPDDVKTYIIDSKNMLK